MTRKLENLDSATLDRISGGCRTVSQSATNPTIAKLSHRGSVMDIATMPASFADIHDASALKDLAHEALPMLKDMLPTMQDALPVMQDVAQDALPPIQELFGHASEVLDSTQLGSGLPDLDLQGITGLDAIGDLPTNWCGTADMSTTDAHVDDGGDAGGAHMSMAQSHMLELTTMHAADQVAQPTIRDHRAHVTEQVSNAVVHDHRTAASDVAADTNIAVRDQR